MNSTPKSNRTTHTPAPWTVGDEDPNLQILVEGPQYSICRCHHHCVGAIELEMRANAHLIAAAPDLLEIAQTIVTICDSGNQNLAELACMETSPLVDAARAAIAKAEGR